MKRLFLFVVVFLLATGLSAQLKKFSVEVPYLPKVKLSDSIQSLLLLNRSMSPEFENYNSDSLQLSFYQSNYKVNRIILDSLVSDSLVRALGEILYDSYRFDIVIPVERNISRFLAFNETPDTLTWNYVKSMCDLYNTDALLVLENMAMRTVTNYKKGQEYLYDGFYRVYSASLDLYYLTKWRLYDPRTETIALSYTDIDTLYWDGAELDLNTLFTNIPQVKDACFETGLFAAAKFAEAISPRWVNETRYYYVLQNSIIDQSVKYAAEGEWNKALENWLPYTQTGSKSTRSRVLFNVALAYEMLGNLDQAISCLNDSQQLYYREVTNHYLKQLISRKSSQKPNKRIQSK